MIVHISNICSLCSILDIVDTLQFDQKTSNKCYGREAANDSALFAMINNIYICSYSHHLNSFLPRLQINQKCRPNDILL